MSDDLPERPPSTEEALALAAAALARLDEALARHPLQRVFLYRARCRSPLASSVGTFSGSVTPGAAG
jgi:hypothetical protein